MFRLFFSSLFGLGVLASASYPASGGGMSGASDEFVPTGNAGPLVPHVAPTVPEVYPTGAVTPIPFAPGVHMPMEVHVPMTPPWEPFPPAVGYFPPVAWPQPMLLPIAAQSMQPPTVPQAPSSERLSQALRVTPKTYIPADAGSAPAQQEAQPLEEPLRGQEEPGHPEPQKASDPEGSEHVVPFPILKEPSPSQRASGTKGNDVIRVHFLLKQDDIATAWRRLGVREADQVAFPHISFLEIDDSSGSIRDQAEEFVQHISTLLEKQFFNGETSGPFQNPVQFYANKYQKFGKFFCLSPSQQIADQNTRLTSDLDQLLCDVRSMGQAGAAQGEIAKDVKVAKGFPHLSISQGNSGRGRLPRLAGEILKFKVSGFEVIFPSSEQTAAQQAMQVFIEKKFGFKQVEVSSTVEFGSAAVDTSRGNRWWKQYANLSDFVEVKALRVFKENVSAQKAARGQ